MVLVCLLILLCDCQRIEFDKESLLTSYNKLLDLLMR